MEKNTTTMAFNDVCEEMACLNRQLRSTHDDRSPGLGSLDAAIEHWKRVQFSSMMSIKNFEHGLQVLKEHKSQCHTEKESIEINREFERVSSEKSGCEKSAENATQALERLLHDHELEERLNFLRERHKTLLPFEIRREKFGNIKAVDFSMPFDCPLLSVSANIPHEFPETMRKKLEIRIEAFNQEAAAVHEAASKVSESLQSLCSLDPIEMKVADSLRPARLIFINSLKSYLNKAENLYGDIVSLNVDLEILTHNQAIDAKVSEEIGKFTEQAVKLGFSLNDAQQAAHKTETVKALCGLKINMNASERFHELIFKTIKEKFDWAQSKLHGELRALAK